MSQTLGLAAVPLAAANWLDIVMSGVLEPILGPPVATRLWSIGSHGLCGKGSQQVDSMRGCSVQAGSLGHTTCHHYYPALGPTATVPVSSFMQLQSGQTLREQLLLC